MLVVLEKESLKEAVELIKNLKKVAVHVPRPLPAEIFKEVDPYVEKYYLPPSTWRRLSKKAKEIIKGKTEISSRRGRFAEVDVETVAQIIAMYRAGASIREIARALNMPKSTVHYILTKERKIRDGGVKILIQ
ncbi:MAG TPA: hypothetical protein EYH14_01095 [Euryarchaeota archaeon]|nr:hypothetical protein [Euryarchaeota archaeon]